MKTVAKKVLIWVESQTLSLDAKSDGGLFLGNFAKNNPVQNMERVGVVYSSNLEEFKQGDNIWFNPNIVYSDSGSLPTVAIDNGFVFDCTDPSWNIFLIERKGVLIPTQRWTLLEREYTTKLESINVGGYHVKAEMSKSGLVTSLKPNIKVKIGNVFLSSFLDKGTKIYYSKKIGENLTINVNGSDYLRVRNPNHFQLDAKDNLIESESDILAIYE